MTLKVIPQGHFPFAGPFSAIRRTFMQHFTRFQLTARLRGPSVTARLIVFGEVALGYYGRIIVMPFVNQQFSLQVVEQGRAVQFVEQSSSDVGRRHPSRPAQRPPTITHHAHSTPVDVLQLSQWGLGQKPSWNKYLAHFSIQIWHLVTLVFQRINWPIEVLGYRKTINAE